VQDIASRAQGEATLVEALKELAVWWETAEFEMTTYEGKRHKCQLIREWKEMTSKVSDNMALVSSLKESRWVGKFLQTIEAYESKIGKVERALYSVQGIQRRWVYLEPILVGGALPDQLDRFNKLDQSFRNVMGVVA
jgi:dynein heavy chain 2